MRFTIAVAPFVLAAVVAASYNEHYYKAKHDGKYYDNEKSARQAYEQRCKELGGKYNDKHGYAHKKHWDTVFRVKDGKSWCEESCDESKKPKDYTGEVAKSLGWEELKHDERKYGNDKKDYKKVYSKDDGKKHDDSKDRKHEHDEDKKHGKERDSKDSKKYEHSKDSHHTKEHKKYEEDNKKDDKRKYEKDDKVRKSYEHKDGKYGKEHERKEYEHKDSKCEYKGEY